MTTYKSKNKTSIPKFGIYHAKRRIGARGLKWLIEEGDLSTRDRISNCRSGLLENGLITLYAELETDLSLLMDTLRQKRKEHRKQQHDREKKLQMDVIKRLGFANRTRFTRTPDIELIARARTLESMEYKRVFEDLLQAKINALQAKSFTDEWYKQLNATHVRDVYNLSSSQLSRVLYKRLNSVGPLGQLASMCMKIQKHANGIRGNVARRYKNYRYKQFTSLLEQISVHLSHHGRLVREWGIAEDISIPNHQRSPTDSYSVLCIDLPTGQVGWPLRGLLDAPAYRSTWSGIQDTEEPVLRFAESVLRPQGQAIEDPLQAWAQPRKADTHLS